MPRYRLPPPPPPKRPKSALSPLGGTLSRSTQAVYRVFTLYVTDPQATIAGIHEHARLSDDADAPYIRECVSLQWLRQSSSKEKWANQREAFWFDVSNRVLEATKSRIVQEQIEEIAELASVRRMALLRVLGGTDADGNLIAALPAKSWEGVAEVLLRLDKHINEKRGIVVATAAAAAATTAARPGGTGSMPMITVTPDVEDGLTREEILQIARDVAARRVLIAPSEK